MRVTAGSTLVDLPPGSSADIVLDVVNTGAVIDGITARVIGLPEQQVTIQPPVLALFPASAGRMTVSLGLPSAFPAGRHPVTVEVFSRQDGIAPEYLDLDLLVPTRPDFRMVVRPEVVRAHRTGRFVLTVTNTGNVRLDVSMAVTDPEKAVTAGPAGRVVLDAGRSSDVLLEARGPRMIFGSEIDRPVTVTVTAVPGDEAAAQADASRSGRPGRVRWPPASSRQCRPSATRRRRARPASIPRHPRPSRNCRRRRWSPSCVSDPG